MCAAKQEVGKKYPSEEKRNMINEQGSHCCGTHELDTAVEENREEDAVVEEHRKKTPSVLKQSSFF